MEVTSIAAVAPIGAGPSSLQTLPEPQEIQLAQLMPAQDSKKPSAVGGNGAFADLRIASPDARADMRSDWSGLAQSVLNGSNKGLLKPKIVELEQKLSQAKATGVSVPPEEIAIMMLQVSHASAITNMLSTSVNAVRRSVSTLVEKTA